MMRVPLIIFTVGLLTSCAQTSFEEFGRKIDMAIRGDDKQGEPTAEPTYSLTINAQPSNCTIKIMNIKPKYHDGIQLKQGSYDILVQKEGYETHRQWVTISNSSIIRDVILKPAQQTVSLATEAMDESVVADMTEKVEVVSETPVSVDEVASKPQVNKVEKSAKIAKPVQQAKPVEKPKEIVISNDILRADYRPPEISQPSELISAEMTEDEQPKFNGAYIKTVDEGFFSDSVQLIEMKESPAYRSVIFRATKKESIGITWLMKQKKKYFALEDSSAVITIPVDEFKGVVIKGKDAEYISLHRAERIVRSYDKEGGKSGAMATFFDSKKNVREGEAVYVPMEHEKVNMAKINDDSYFITFKDSPKKGLYIAWAGDHFWFFNLI